MFQNKYSVAKSLAALLLCLLLMPAMVQAKTAVPPTINSTALLDMITMNKGKVVLVNFFATWCPPCREEIPGLVSLSKAYPADKVVIIGVSLDENPALLPAFMKKLGVNYSVFHASMDVPALYGITTIPHNVIYDRAGKLSVNAAGYVEEADIKNYIDTLLEQK